MNRKITSQILTIGTIAGAYFLGSHIERHRLIENFRETAGRDSYLFANQEDLLKQIDRKPGLPIFGNVSAAELTTTTDVNLTATPLRVSQIMKYGFPGLDNVRSYSDFVLSYDRRSRIPHWVFEHLTVDSVSRNENVDRSKCNFRPDESIHPYFRSDNKDYFRSGYDRGHMAAAGNHRRHQKHCEDTFYLTNMAPQVGQGFNRDAWNRLEMYVRKLTQQFPNVYVCTGPLYLPVNGEDGKRYVKYEVIGTNNVAVPTHFYKVIMGENADKTLEMEAYIMPNKPIDDNTPLEVFRVPPETVERSAGLLFFDRMNRAKLVRINGRKV